MLFKNSKHTGTYGKINLGDVKYPLKSEFAIEKLLIIFNGTKTVITSNKMKRDKLIK